MQALQEDQNIVYAMPKHKYLCNSLAITSTRRLL